MRAEIGIEVESDDTAGGARIVLGILEQAKSSPIELDRSLRDQGLTSYQAVLVAAALEEHGVEELDYVELLRATPRELAERVKSA